MFYLHIFCLFFSFYISYINIKSVDEVNMWSLDYRERRTQKIQFDQEKLLLNKSTFISSVSA